MIKSKGIFAVSFIAMMVVGGAYANIASQGYVDQQIGTRAPAGNYATKTELNAKQNASTAVEVAAAGTAVGDATHPVYVNASGVATKIDKVAAAAKADTATTADSATKATQDASGRVIADTYATKDEIPDEITVDAALSADSTNPVQNKVVKAALDKKLENTATGTGSLSTGGATPATAANAVVIGDAASGAAASVVVGKSAKSSEAGLMSVAVGMNASANDREAVAIGSNANVAGQGVAIGTMAKTTVSYGTAVGYRAETGAGTAIAIGQSATSTALGAIQLGSGTNSTEGTFNVGFGANKNYQLLDNDGKIPDERMPDTVLTNTATGEGAFAVGNNSGALGQNSVAVGVDAKGDGANSVVLGKGSKVLGALGIAIGSSATVEANGSIAIGASANATAPSAIQLGRGVNSEGGTFKIRNYKLLNANGKIPGERLQISVGSATEPTGYADIWIE